MRWLLAVLVAATVTGGVLIVVNRDPAPPKPAPHVAIAPGASAPGPVGTVYNSSLSPQQAADAVIEDGKHPEFVPLPDSAFKAPIAHYRAYAQRQAALLERAARRRDFNAAFDHWLLIGAAYGAMGDLESQITDAIEAHEGPALVAAAQRLPRALSRAQLDPVDYAIRAHEILEDVQRDMLGDRQGVRATADGVQVTRTVIGTLQPILAGRGDALQAVDTRLTRLEGTLNEIKRKHGEWPVPAALGVSEREQLTGNLGAALEALSSVPGALETSLPPKIPALK